MTRSRLPWRGPRGRTGPADPFAVLGLAAGTTLTDDDVRAAWRRAAAATHPDRPDGGDPAAFADAAAAYTVLRTPFGRTEALADLRARPRAGRSGGIAWTRLTIRRPGRLAVRVLAGAGFCAAVFAIGGWQPAPIALSCGAIITALRGAWR